MEHPSHSNRQPERTEMARVVPRPLFLLLAICFILAFATIIALGCCAQPAKDDFLSAAMFRGTSLLEALQIQYRLHNGRLFSALIMRFSPLQYQSFGTYKLVCIGFAALLAGGIFLIVDFMLRRQLHRTDRFAVFVAVYLCIHGALGNIAEFYYWLPAISCYGVASLLFLAFLRVLPVALDRLDRKKAVCLGLSTAIAPALSLCCEPGAIMGCAAITIFGLNRYRAGRLSIWTFLFIFGLLVAGFALSALSPGNALRFAASPHSRGILQTLAGSLYSMAGTAQRILVSLIPAAIFIRCIFYGNGRSYRLDRNKLTGYLLITGAFWFAGELLTFYGIGGLAALRVRNSFMFLVGSLVLTSVALAVSETGSSDARSRSRPRLMLYLSGIWILAAAFLPGNPLCAGMQDLVTGAAARYDADMKTVYAEAAQAPAGLAAVRLSSVRVIPASLFIAQPLILKEEVKGWPWFNVHMAAYFGHERLYCDSLARTPQSDELFQAWLRDRRGDLF